MVVWKLPLYKADPEKCYSEILSIGESATPEQIVEAARNPESELHKCFEWDDTIAAERWRVHQARNIVAHLVYAAPNAESPTQIRLLQNVPGTGYKPFKVIVKNKDEYEKLLARCTVELRAVKARYQSVSEYSEVWDLID